MRFIKETTLAVFSIIMLILSVLSIILIFGWVDLDLFTDVIKGILAKQELSNTVLVVNIIFIVLSFICIFYDERKEKESKNGILLENEKGNLLISKNTLEKIIVGVANNFESVEIRETIIELDKEGKLNIDVTIDVSEDAVIKELTSNLQLKIKEAIKKSSDIEVKTVNVGVQGIISKKPEAQA